MTPHRPTCVIYHGNCLDGFGAAWATWMHIRDNRSGQPVTYLPAQHGEPPPETDPKAVLYILDFSYPLETMLKLHDRHQGRVILIDHHESALVNLDGKIPGCIIDLEHSGACLAWNYWSRRNGSHSKATPKLLLHIEDRDMWAWKIPDSREITQGLDARPMDFHHWLKLTETHEMEQLRREGHAILQKQDKLMRKLAGTVLLRNVAGYTVPTVNTPTAVSEICEVLLEQHPEAPFVAAYCQQAGENGLIREQWSLRSRDGFNVREVAETMGGGGHPTASGFVRDLQPDPITANALATNATEETSPTPEQERYEHPQEATP